jgi:hypothetical protein
MRGQSAVGGGEKAEGVGLGVLGGAKEDRCQGRRRDRKLLIRGADEEAAVLALDGDAAGLQHTAVLVAEDGDEDLVAEALLLGLPVDVEERGVAAGGAVFEHVPPVAVLAAQRHVVGHDVEDLAELDLAQTVAEAFVGGGSAQLVVDPLVVDDIVAVQASRCSL